MDTDGKAPGGNPEPTGQKSGKRKLYTTRPPLGAIPRAQVAVLLLQEAIESDEPDLLLAEAEHQLWMVWCSVQRVLADRAGEIEDYDSGRAA
jgi:hypothetical protein